MSEKSYMIYKYTSPSGGVYIGQTSNNIEKRSSKNGKQYLSIDKKTGKYLQPSIANAIIKYGWDNIKKEILYEGLTSEDADEKEISLIKYYKENGLCYNIASGGKCVTGVREHKVKQYDLNGTLIKVWDSIRDAEKYIGDGSQGNIVACCRGKKHRAYGYIWRYNEDESSIEPLSPYRCSIEQYTKTDEYVATYKNIREACKKTGIGETSIGNVLHNWSKSAGGYIWKFAQNKNNETLKIKE